MVGVWLGDDLEKNEEEMSNAAAVVAAGHADILAVGNEVLLRGDLTEAQLLDYIERFRGKYPKHADPVWMEDPSYAADYQWILDAEAKYGDRASTSEPYTADDIAFREEYFLTNSPKRFNEVLPVVEQAIAAADEGARGDLEATRDRLLADQRAYADERMAKARDQYKSGQLGPAAGTLITDILTLTDPQLVDRAAEVLVGFAEADAIFRGMRQAQPERYAKLLENDRIRRFVDANLTDEEAEGEG